MIQPRVKLEDAPDVLTVKELSEVLGIGRTAAYEVIRRGKLRSLRAGRLIKIPKAALAEALAAGGTL
ncbi:MAG: helix-turn-helix domain-containing protein [Candidatus Eremiobacteraeota bacterium]|nr:helix-turn-helix domain-containing protein [Candidatus Eremiobacteraeota bacterium]